MNVKDKILKDKKVMLIISIVLSIVILVTFSLSKKNKDDISEQNSVTRFTDIYNNSQIKTNGLQSSEVVFRDSDGNVTEKHESETEAPPDTGKDKITIKAQKFISNFTDGINKGEYERLYSLFNREYIDNFDYTLDNLKSVFRYNGTVSSEVTNVNENEVKDRLIITAKFKEQSTGYINLVDFTLYNDGTIVDIPIYNTAYLNKTKEIDGVTYTVKNRYETRLGSIYDIVIDNESDKLVDVQDMLIKNNDTISTYEIISANKEIKAYPGQPLTFMMKLPNTNGITSLVLKCKNLDSYIDEVEIYK